VLQDEGKMSLRQERPYRVRGRERQYGHFNTATVASGLVIVAVALALFVLFPLDWMRTPSVTVIVDQGSFSPNSDGSQDTVTGIYTLSELATVSVEVQDATNRVVRTLLREQKQGSGQHFVTWDGRDEVGQAVADGTYRLVVEVKGTLRASTNHAQVIVDTQPPLLRLANLPENLKIKDPQLTVQGIADPEALIWVNDDPQPVALGNGGSFTLRRRLEEGPNRIQVRAVDQAGNVTSVVREVDLVTRPPEIVIETPHDGLWINQRLISVQGRVEPGIILKVNDNEVLIGADGSFTADVMLQEGENVLRFEATDEVGNVSTEERIIHLKTNPPVISINIDNYQVVDKPSLPLWGQTEVGTALMINGQPVALDNRGRFQTLVNLVEGENVIKVNAQDQAGNVVTLERVVKYATGNLTPGLPAVLTDLPYPLLIGGGLFLGALWLVLAYWRQPVSLSLNADRQVFYPSRPEEGEVVILSLGLSRTASTTVEVLDEQDRPLATLLYRRRRDSGNHYLVWDGYDDYGRPAPPGSYIIQAVASTLTATASSAVQVNVASEPSEALPARRRKIGRDQVIDLRNWSDSKRQ
jgi:flagellar hook assembly protein FlgD